jgi:hypothetical protein
MVAIPCRSVSVKRIWKVPLRVLVNSYKNYTGNPRKKKEEEK